MTFTSWGRLVAILAVLLGLLRIGTAVVVLMSDDPQTAARSLLGSSTTGAAIDQALYVIIFGICLGVLTDISRALQKD